MVQLQQLTAMRPGEVVLIRACDIDMTGDVWLYRPEDHKNRWRDHERVIPWGLKAQAIIEAFPSCLSRHSGLFCASCRHCCRTAVGHHAFQGIQTASFGVNGCRFGVPVAVFPSRRRPRAQVGH